MRKFIFVGLCVVVAIAVTLGLKAAIVGLGVLAMGAVISGGRIIEGSVATPLRFSGTPSNGTNEVQTATLGGTGSGSTFRLKHDGVETGDITWSATNATLLSNINTALNAAFGTSQIVATDSNLSSGLGDLLLTFSGSYYSKAAVSLMTARITAGSLTVAIAETTPGVSATFRGAPLGAELIDTSTGTRYVNGGTENAPSWTTDGGAGSPRLAKISQTVLISQFTDGGGASGTKALTSQIPAGAIFQHSRVLVNVAVSGDTTAVLTIGDGSDVDRYNTGTPSVFTTGQKDMGNPSGVRDHLTAATVTLTVTTGSDFGLANVLGSITVDLYYIATV